MAAKAKESNFYEKVAPILLVVVIGLAFAVGVLWQKVTDLQGGGTKTSPTVANNEGAAAPSAPTTGKLDAAQAEVIPPVDGDDHVRGGQNPEVYIVEYSDFECPYCASFHPTAQQALSEYGDQIAWTYRHFPLDTIHPKARPAANASECIAELAGNEGFWAFADEVFGNQAAGLADLSATAVKIGVNKAAFDTCMNENRHEAVVEVDYQEGIEAGVTGTPGNFIVNSKGEVWKLPGAVPYTTLKATIDEALAS
jgi:protein-disulfide isomerase